VASQCGWLVVRYCHGLELVLGRIRLGWCPRLAFRRSHDAQTHSVTGGDFQFLAFNLSGVCKMALEGRLKGVQAGTSVHAAGISGAVHV
jgi:hypothetical protein